MVNRLQRENAYSIQGWKEPMLRSDRKIRAYLKKEQPDAGNPTGADQEVHLHAGEKAKHLRVSEATGMGTGGRKSIEPHHS